MAPSHELARDLVDYDERLAVDVLMGVAQRLGGASGDDEPDLTQIAKFLGDPEQARLRSLRRLGDVEDAPATTGEWKSQFAHSERLRTFGLALVEALQEHGWS
jgi:DNA-binding transcriptional ArsR family regulator